MHPMFVKLFLENDADDVLAEEEDRRRAANRARRVRSRQAIRVIARDRDRRPAGGRRRGRTASANSEVTASRRMRPGPHGTSGTTRQRTVP